MLAVAAIAVLVIGATVIFAALRGGGVDRIVLAANILHRFKTEIIGTAPSFYARIGKYPGHLSDLTNRISTSDVDSCGDPYRANPDVNTWRGPYHLIPFNPAVGYTLSSGIVAQDATIRTTFTNGALALAIVMIDVPVADAQALKGKVDGTTGDTISFTPSGNSPLTVHYRMPITAAC
ncbi:MAG: hypothetical protein WEA80_07905 [Gemmatimonadaceae bacterium]